MTMRSSNVHAAQNLQSGAVVVADRDRPQMDFAIAANHRHARAFLAEEHGVDRDGDLLRVDADAEVHLAERAGQQVPILVGHVHFRHQGARQGIDGLGRAHHRAFEFLSGELRQGDEGFHSVLDGRCVVLRNVDIHAQRIDAGDVEQLFACGPSD